MNIIFKQINEITSFPLASTIEESTAEAICFRVCLPCGRPTAVRFAVKGEIPMKLATNIYHVNGNY